MTPLLSVSCPAISSLRFSLPCLSEFCLSPHHTGCLRGGTTSVTRLLERHFNWRSRYRNKQAPESFSWLLVSLMLSTLSQRKVLCDSPTLCHTSFQKRNPSSSSVRNSHLLPSPACYCRIWFTLQWNFLQMSRCFKGSWSQRYCSDTAWHLLTLCTVCPHTLQLSSRPALALRPLSWQAQNICPFEQNTSSLETVLPYSREE